MTRSSDLHFSSSFLLVPYSVCREWRCKYEGDKATSESLEALAKVTAELLPEIKKASKDATVNRLVCGSCLDFKLMTTVPLEDYGPWSEA